jgi:glycerol transport system substrate-binding protein
MDNLAEEMDQVMARLERAGMARCAPKLNKKEDPKKWLSDKGAVGQAGQRKAQG